MAFIGFFECVDDPEVATRLFDCASQQARAWGATALRGPRNLTRIEQTGLTVEGFDAAPPMLAGHHPRYYRALVEGAAFMKHHDHLAYDIDVVDADGAPRPLPDNLARQAASCEIAGLEVHRARYARLATDLGLAHEVFVDAFRDVPENTPMPRAQFRGLGRALLLVTSRNVLQIATVAGRAAGFALCFPKMNEAIRHARGRLGPLGATRLALGLRRIRAASFKLLGVLPRFRGAGLHARLIAEAIERVRKAGYERPVGVPAG